MKVLPQQLIKHPLAEGFHLHGRNIQYVFLVAYLQENLASGYSYDGHYPMPLSSQPAVAKHSINPHSETAASEVVSLPVYGTLCKQTQNEVIKAVISFVQINRGVIYGT